MASLSSLSRLSAVLTLDTTNFIRNSELVSARLIKLRKDALGFGQNFSRSFTFAFALVGAAATKVAADFDRVDAQLQAVTGGKGLERLRDQSGKLGRETIFTRTEVASLQLELSKLGFQASETAGAVEATTKITTVFGGDLTKVGTTIAEVIRQFSNSNLDAKRVADVLAVAFRNTALSTENFAQAMKNVGSVANITGNDFETTVALLGLLANAGQKGGISGTRLKGVMIRLGKQFGVTGNELKLLTSGQLNFNQLIEIFRNRAGVAAASIGEMGEEFELLKRQLLESEGAADAMAEGLDKRLFFSLERIRNATQAVGITIGDSLTGTMEKAADIFQNFAIAVAETDKETLKLIVTLTALLAAVGPVVFSLTQIAGLVGGIIASPAIAGVVVTLTALVATLVATKLAYEASYGTIERANKQFSEQVKSVDDLARKGLPQLKKAQQEVSEEREKFLNENVAFRLFGNEGLSRDDIATLDALDEAFEDIGDKIKSAESIIAKDLPGALQEFNKEAERIGRDIAANIVQRDLIQQQIRRSFQDYGRETFFIGRGRGGLTAQETFERLGQDELSVSLRINNLQAEADRAVEQFVELFGQADLSLFSTAELDSVEQQYAENIESMRRGLEELNKQADSGFQRVWAQLPLILEDAYERLNLINIFTLNWFAELGNVLGIVYDTFAALLDNEEVLAKIAKTETEIALQEALRLQYAEEIARRQEEQLKLAEEAQKLAEDFAGTFGNAADAKESIEDFNALLDTLKDVAGEFGTTTGRVLETQATIALLSEDAQKLGDILKRGSFTTNVLESAFGDDRNLEAQKKAIKGIVSALKDYTAELIAAGDFNLAVIFERALRSYEDLEKEITRKADLEALRKMTNESLALSEALRDLGNLEQIEFLRRELGLLQTELEGVLLAGQLSEAKDIQKVIAFIKAQIAELEKTVSETKFDFQLGLLDPRVAEEVDELNERLRQLGIVREDVLTQLNKDFNSLISKNAGLAGVVDPLTDTTLLANLDKLNDFIDNAGDGVDTSAYEELRDLIVKAVKALTDLKTESDDIGEDLSLKDLQKQLQDIQQDSKDFQSLKNFGLFTEAEAANQELQTLQRELEFAIINRDRLNDPRGLAKLIGKFNDAREVVNNFSRQQQAIQFFQQQLSFIGDAFVEAAQGGEDFFTAFKQGFINTFNALVGKLITLIALFAVLAAFGVVQFNPKAFGSFLSAGFGFDQLPGGVSLPGSKSSSAGALAVQGTISGNNIVLANQRGTRAIDRTFG